MTLRTRRNPPVWLAALLLCGGLAQAAPGDKPAAAKTPAPAPKPAPAPAPAAPATPAPAGSAKGAVASKADAFREAARLLEKAADARDGGNRSYAEQLFSSAELLVGP